MISHGVCQCGCGEKTDLWAEHCPARGRIFGEPKRFVHGHNGRTYHAPYIVEDRGHATPCHIWQGCRTVSDPTTAYGRIRVGSKMKLAHRVYYEREKGPIPEGMDIDHLCKQRLCVNTDHHEPVTFVENMRRGKQTKYNPDIVRAVRADHGKRAEVAARFGMPEATVKNLRNRRTWREI